MGKLWSPSPIPWIPSGISGIHPPFHGFHMDYPGEGKVQQLQQHNAMTTKASDDTTCIAMDTNDRQQQQMTTIALWREETTTMLRGQVMNTQQWCGDDCPMTAHNDNGMQQHMVTWLAARTHHHPQSTPMPMASTTPHQCQGWPTTNTMDGPPPTPTMAHHQHQWWLTTMAHQHPHKRWTQPTTTTSPTLIMALHTTHK